MTIRALKGLKDSACCKIDYKGYEISIAMDDSLGAYSQYMRSDIRVYCNGADVTASFMQPDQHKLSGDAETLRFVFAWIDLYGGPAK